MQDIRFSPINPFSEWIDINRQATDFRITMLNVTVDDVQLVNNPFFPHVEIMNDRLSEPTLT